MKATQVADSRFRLRQLRGPHNDPVGTGVQAASPAFIASLAALL